ncbi:MAG: hypothetical protein KDI82_13350 [Gammaproteobacteria bacterium]|nr:hypothetical protein [Gammaproteobacteria bacterium]
MSDYRIVFNEHTEKYRVERRGLFGWQFVMDQSGTDYLTFDSRETAQQYVCATRQVGAGRQSQRRWQVVDTCCAPSTQA